MIGSNLDEFFMKRIGGLKQQVGAELKLLSIDIRTPRATDRRELRGDPRHPQQTLERELLTLLARQDIRIVRYAALDEAQRQKMAVYFRDNIYPLLTPQGMDPAHPFPFISNLSLNLLVATRHSDNDHVYLQPDQGPDHRHRHLQIHPGRSGRARLLFEDVIANNLEIIFPGMVIESCELFRVTRNAITEKWPDQAIDLLSTSQNRVAVRKFAEMTATTEIDRRRRPQHRDAGSRRAY